MFKKLPDAECRPLLKKLLNYCRLIKLSWDPTQDEIIEKFADVLLLMKKYINADAAEFYLVENKFVTRIEGIDERKAFKGNVIYSIDQEEVPAAFSAGNTQSYYYNTPTNKNKVFPKGIGRGVKMPDQVLSFPIMSSDGLCLGVFEFYRKRAQPFSTNEISMAKCLISWLGRSVRKRPVNELAENETFRTWTQDFSNFQSGDSMNLEHFISRALRALQTKTQADLVNFYKVEHGKYHMYGQVSPGIFLEKNREFLVETNLFLNAVITRHRAVKVDRKDIMSFLRLDHLQFKDEKDVVIPIHNYLCVPTGSSSKLLGIVELVNKKEEKDFDERDIEFSIHCGRLCCAAIHLDKKNVEKTEMLHTAKSQGSVIMDYMSACPHRFDLFYKRLNEVKKPANFYNFEFYPTLDEMKYLEQYCYFIMSEVFDLKDPRDSNSLRIIDYIITTERGYRGNYYHNFEHAYYVCHTLFLIMRNNTHVFTKIEMQALVVAALGHDVDHPGLTNTWFAVTQNPIVQCYEDACLEHHHCNICRLIVQMVGIFADLKPEDYKHVMKLIYKAIMGTDFLKGLEIRFRISNRLDQKVFSLTNQKDRELLVCLIMTSSDFGAQVKRIDINYRICRNLYKELNSERAKCFALGNESPWLAGLSDNKKVPLFQVQFNEEICIPMFQLLGSILQGLTPMYQNCRELVDAWSAANKAGIEWTYFDDEVIYKPEEP